MIKLVGIFLASFVAGIVGTVLVAEPYLEKQLVARTKQAKPTMSDYNKSRMVKMKLAKDNKTILERLISMGDDQLVLTNPAKSRSKHPELVKFAQDSAYSAAYNRELARILMEDFGYAPSHGTGKHCDSVGC